MSEFGFAEMGYRRSASSLREEAEWEVLSCVDELCHHLYDFSRNDLVVYGRPHFGHCFRLVREAIALLSSEQGEYLISREPSLMKRIEFVRSRLIVWTDAFEQEACQSYRAGCLDHPYLRAVSGQLDYEVS